MRPVIYCIFAVITLLSQMSSAGHAQSGSPIVLTPTKVEGSLLGKKKGRVATDISGMSCMPPNGPRQTCLLINDENRNAQFATLEADRLIVGQPIELIGDEPDPNTVGARPDIECKVPGDFEDLDGEGVAYSEPYFYIVGSHGCSRKKGEFRLSSFILARVRVDREGRPADRNGNPLPADRLKESVETTYRVSDLLRRAGAAADFFGQDLNSENGLNIEGIAIGGETVWFGLRAPVDKEGNAFLVSGNTIDLFRSGHATSHALPKVIPMHFGRLGIRDLAMLPDRRLIVLAGAAQGPEVPFKLFIVDTDSKTKTLLGQLPEVRQPVDGTLEIGKAEAVAVLDTTADRARLMVLFDGLANGAPHNADIQISK